MTLAGQILEERAAAEIMAALLGRRCWMVGCGGCTGTRFNLALGRRMLRHPGIGGWKRPSKFVLRNPYEGEFGLMVWCSWRLESSKGPLTSSEDGSPALVKGLKLLEGKRVARVSIQEGWYLRVEFNVGLTLTVFPDRVGPNASPDENWSIQTPELQYSVTTDLTCEVARRDYPPSMLPKGRLSWRSGTKNAVAK